MFSLLCQLASAFVGAVIPVFYSYKTIKRPTQKNLSYWSKYWSVFGSFLTIDAILSTLFIHYFIPFYELGKLVFLIWAVDPRTAGAQFVFDKVLAPFIRRYERKLDIYVEHMVNNVATHGPYFVITAGTTLWTIAKNVHALSSSNIDPSNKVCLQDDHRLTIVEIHDGEDYQVHCNPVAALPGDVEVKVEHNSDDDVVFLEERKQNGLCKPTTSGISNAPERKCTRRAASSGRRRVTKKKQEVKEEMQEDGEDKNKTKPIRRPRRLAAAKRQMVITEGIESGSEA